MTRIIGVLFLLLAALIVGSFMMIYYDLMQNIQSGPILRETLSISTRIALSVFLDVSSASSDEIDIDQLMVMTSSTGRWFAPAALVSGIYGIFLLLSSRKESTKEAGS